MGNQHLHFLLKHCRNEQSQEHYICNYKNAVTVLMESMHYKSLGCIFHLVEQGSVRGQLAYKWSVNPRLCFLALWGKLHSLLWPTPPTLWSHFPSGRLMEGLCFLYGCTSWFYGSFFSCVSVSLIFFFHFDPQAVEIEYRLSGATSASGWFSKWQCCAGTR